MAEESSLKKILIGVSIPVLTAVVLYSLNLEKKGDSSGPTDPPANNERRSDQSAGQGGVTPVDQSGSPESSVRSTSSPASGSVWPGSWRDQEQGAYTIIGSDGQVQLQYIIPDPNTGLSYTITGNGMEQDGVVNGTIMLMGVSIQFQLQVVDQDHIQLITADLEGQTATDDLYRVR